MKILLNTLMIILSLSMFGCQKEPSVTHVESVTISASSVSIVEGESYTLTATVSPSNADNKLILWTTSDASVATVKDGTVTAVAKGTATITAKSDDGGHSETCSVEVAIGSCMFEDPNFEAYCLLNFDENGDGIISNAEALNVTDMTVDTDIIASVKGIEYFKNLRTLTCGLQDIVSSSSVHGVVHYFDSKGIERTSKLKSLDISHNPALEYVCCYSNPIETLDVTKNPALKVLYCSDNKIRSLDLSKNISLTHLRCNHNLLTSLDVGINIHLKRLDCENNDIEILDISNNKDLLYLGCPSRLNYLYVWKGFDKTAFTTIHISEYTQIIEVD